MNGRVRCNTGIYGLAEDTRTSVLIRERGTSVSMSCITAADKDPVFKNSGTCVWLYVIRSHKVIYKHVMSHCRLDQRAGESKSQAVLGTANSKTSLPNRVRNWLRVTLYASTCARKLVMNNGGRRYFRDQ
jgi:hypothetical protein